jgi:hypothetical protein
MIVKNRSTNSSLRMKQDLSNVLNSSRIQRLAMMLTIANNVIRLESGLPILTPPVCKSCSAIGIPDNTRVGP